MRDSVERNKFNQLHEDLLTMVSHDLRMPLTNVISSLETLASYPSIEDNPSLTSLLEIAKNSTDHLRFLVDTILEISQMEASPVIGTRRPIDIAALIRDVIKWLQPTLDQKEILVEYQLSPALPEISVNVNVIRRVLINLIENAAKYSAAKGKMWIGAQLKDNFLRIWIKDSGSGINPMDRERIFDKFTRLNPKSWDGFGLGLYYCKEAVTAHGGQIWVEGEPGNGSTFILSLPIHNAGINQEST